MSSRSSHKKNAECVLLFFLGNIRCSSEPLPVDNDPVFLSITFMESGNLFINAVSFFRSFEVNNRKPFICLYTYLTCPYLSEIDLIIPALFLLLIFLLNCAGTGEKRRPHRITNITSLACL